MKKSQKKLQVVKLDKGLIKTRKQVFGLQMVALALNISSIAAIFTGIIMGSASLASESTSATISLSGFGAGIIGCTGAITAEHYEKKLNQKEAEKDEINFGLDFEM